MAHPTPGNKDAHATAHAEHITSWAPLVVALAVPFLYLAILWPRIGLPLGLLFGAIGLGQWLREDFRRFKDNRLPHYGPGMPGPLLGVWLFIGTEVLIFGGIFAVWFVGEANLGASWGVHDNGDPVHLPVFATFVNTMVLIVSGGTLHWGMTRLKKNDQRGFIVGLVLTILLGAAFLAQQAREYTELIHAGITLQGVDAPGGTVPPNDLFGSTFYMLTGTHGLHVAGGLFVLILVLWRALKKTQTKKHHLLLETAAIYWHFVDVVWIFLFLVVYKPLGLFF